MIIYKKINNSICDDINGWFNENNKFLFSILLNYQNEININGNILELGVYYGKCFVFMYNFLKNTEKLIGIDNLPFFKKTQEIYKLYDNINFYIDNTSNLLNLNISNVRFCHIDASHTYDDVYLDIKNAYTTLIPGSIMILDDFSTIDYLNGPIAAYYMTIIKDKLELCPFLISNNKIYLSNKYYASLYYNYLKNNMNKYIPDILKDKLFIKSCKSNSIFDQPVISCSDINTGLDQNEQITIYNY